METHDGSPVILLAEDDPGHARLIEINLRDAGVDNEIIWLRDGQHVLDYLGGSGDAPRRCPGVRYLLLLDLHMPRINGIEVLSWIRRHHTFRRLPVVILTTTDDPREVDLCHRLGCSMYITKPVDYDRFASAMRQLANLLRTMTIPAIPEAATPSTACLAGVAG